MRKLNYTVTLCCATMLILPFKAFSAEVGTQAENPECLSVNCSDLGYSKSDVDGCLSYINCPFDPAYKACTSFEVENTCGENFVGLTKCPADAICKPCQIGDLTFMKEVNCTKGTFDLASWGCVEEEDIEDVCPDGYAFDLAGCGSGGWVLGSQTTTSTGGHVCNICSPKYCSPTEYPYLTCTNGACVSCQSGKNPPIYKCRTSDMVYYSNRCLFVMVKNGVWQASFPSACCSYKQSNGITTACYNIAGKSVSSYPVSGATVSCGSIVQKDSNTVYYDYY